VRFLDFPEADPKHTNARRGAVTGLGDTYKQHTRQRARKGQKWVAETTA
jgi:hypothetical protein